MAYELPPLPYAHDALEPFIDTMTMQIHHGKHHATYVTNLNAALAQYPDFQKHSVDDLIRNIATVPDAIRTAVRNNGGGHANHAMFWQIMAPKAGGDPSGPLADAIKASFGSFEAFKGEFKKAALGRFGSGWGWLVTEGGTLKIVSTANADTPMAGKQTALLTVDVWEHAYYLDYQNRRPDFVQAFLDHLVNWDFVAGNLAKAK